MIVKCAQTGKNLIVKPTDLSPEDDEPLSGKHFISGCGIMLDECHKQYPVQFICFAGMSILYYRNATQQHEVVYTLWRSTLYYFMAHTCTLL